MPLDSLATEEDVGDRFVSGALDGAQLARATAWLADASARARVAAQGQVISLVENDAVRLTAYGRTLRLPQRPVNTVTAIDGLTGARWRWNGGELLTRCDGGSWDGLVTVTYSHGLMDGEWGRELARGIVCDAVVRALLVEYPGLRSETTLGRSYTYDERFRGGGAQLTAEDEQQLDRAFGRD